jgi:hypothetical protein
MKNAGELLEVRSRTFSFAVRRIHIDRGRRLRPAPRSLLAGIDRQPSCLGAPSAWIEHRHGRVIGEQMVGREHVPGKTLAQRLEPPAGPADPSSQRRTCKIDSVAGEDLRLPIQRRVVAIFADQHLSKQRRRRQTAGDRPFWRRRLRHRLANPAGVFGTNGADDAQLRRNPIQHLAHALAHDMQRAAAIGADHALNIDADLFARQMAGQRFATRGPLARLLFARRTLLLLAGEIAVDVFERERQLIGIKALGPTAKLRPLQRLDDRLQALDLAVAMLDGGSHIANEMLQKSRLAIDPVDLVRPEPSRSQPGVAPAKPREVVAIAQSVGFEGPAITEMPANNLSVVFRASESSMSRRARDIYDILQHEDRERSVSRLSHGWRGLGQVARGLVLLEVRIFVFKDRLQVRTEKTHMDSHRI